MTATNDDIVEQFGKVVNKVLFLKRKDLFAFDQVRFYPSEVHLMLVLDEKCSTNATKIGEQLGVTKGAVSQTLSRLEKKGVLIKEKDTFNKNELILTFTKFGARALKFYKNKIGAASKQQGRQLSKYTAKEKQAIYRFLLQCEDILETLSD